jgi:hypothetical protein
VATDFGILETKRWAKELLYWPNMMKEIENNISCCSLCEENAPLNSKEQNFPFEKVA